MPRKKKKNTASKKKEATRPVRTIITEWEGWKSGDLAWGKTFALNKSIYGEIIEFHPKDNHGPAVTILDVVQGGYVTILVSTLSDKDPKKVRLRKRKK